MDEAPLVCQCRTLLRSLAREWRAATDTARRQRLEHAWVRGLGRLQRRQGAGNNWRGVRMTPGAIAQAMGGKNGER